MDFVAYHENCKVIKENSMLIIGKVFPLGHSFPGSL